VLLACLVVLLAAAAVLLMAMPFVLVRYSRQHQDTPVRQLLPETPGPG
jgi:hypothetical protein